MTKRTRDDSLKAFQALSVVVNHTSVRALELHQENKRLKTHTEIRRQANQGSTIIMLCGDLDDVNIFSEAFIKYNALPTPNNNTFFKVVKLSCNTFMCNHNRWSTHAISCAVHAFMDNFNLLSKTKLNLIISKVVQAKYVNLSTVKD